MASATPRQDLLETLHELSQLLNTGLDRTTLGVLVNLCEAGVNPEALAQVVKEMGVEARAFALAQVATQEAESTASIGMANPHPSGGNRSSTSSGSSSSSTSSVGPAPHTNPTVSALHTARRASASLSSTAALPGQSDSR